MKKIGLTADELESIFSQLKTHDSLKLQTQVYDAYAPLISVFAQKFELEEEVVHDLYNDIFSCIYNNVLDGIFKPKDFTMYLQNVMAKQCLSKQASKGAEEFVKESLSDRLIAQEAVKATNARKKELDVARRSLFMITTMLDKIANDPELAESYGITKVHIAMIRDYHGINAGNVCYKLEDIAAKYNVTESRAKAMLVVGLKKIRSIDEFNMIKQGKIQ